MDRRKVLPDKSIPGMHIAKEYPGAIISNFVTRGISAEFRPPDLQCER
jgi:hypothetical protein